MCMTLYAVCGTTHLAFDGGWWDHHGNTVGVFVDSSPPPSSSLSIHSVRQPAGRGGDVPPPFDAECLHPHLRQLRGRHGPSSPPLRAPPHPPNLAQDALSLCLCCLSTVLSLSPRLAHPPRPALPRRLPLPAQTPLRNGRSKGSRTPLPPTTTPHSPTS